MFVQSKESQLLQMSSRQTELESRVLEVTRLCENERESARNQEQSLRDEVSQLSSGNNQLNGDKTGILSTLKYRKETKHLRVPASHPNLPTLLACYVCCSRFMLIATVAFLLFVVVLVDEIQDLRLCLQSADRELVEVKADLRQEREQAESKSAELYLRVSFRLTSLSSSL